MIPPVPRFIFGTVWMSCVDLEVTLEVFFAHMRARDGGYIACTCTHGIVEAECDKRLREALNGSLMTLPDGMPTVWVGRAKGMPVRRVTAPDFLEAVMADGRARALRHYFYGGCREVLERIGARCRALLGDQALAGVHAPPIRPPGAPEDPQVLADIAESRPDVIWVGLGLPKQEYWMQQYAARFPSTVMVGVGAAFDWFAGAKPRAPKWLQGLGLEWLHRLACEPRRLWPRYRAVLPPAMAMLLRELAGS